MKAPKWVPDRAEWFTIRQTDSGRGLEIRFYRPQDITAELVGRVHHVGRLADMLHRVDQVTIDPLTEIRGGLMDLIKRIDEHA